MNARDRVIRKGLRVLRQLDELKLEYDKLRTELLSSGHPLPCDLERFFAAGGAAAHDERPQEARA